MIQVSLNDSTVYSFVTSNYVYMISGIARQCVIHTLQGEIHFRLDEIFLPKWDLANQLTWVQKRAGRCGRLGFPHVITD